MGWTSGSEWKIIQKSLKTSEDTLRSDSGWVRKEIRSPFPLCLFHRKFRQPELPVGSVLLFILEKQRPQPGFCCNYIIFKHGLKDKWMLTQAWTYPELDTCTICSRQSNWRAWTLNYSGYFANAGDWEGFDQLPDPHPLRLKLPYSLSYLNQALKNTALWASQPTPTRWHISQSASLLSINLI